MEISLDEFNKKVQMTVDGIKVKKRLKEPLQSFINGYFVSTVDSVDRGLETMVFPAKKGAKVVETMFLCKVVGVDFGNPLEQYTKHYKTVKEARQGHKDTIQELLKRGEADADKT